MQCCLALHRKSSYSELFWSVFSRIWTEYGEMLRIQSNCVKIRTRITPNKDTFDAVYYGKTCRHLNVRVGKRSGISPLTGKMSKSKTTTVFKDHMFFCDQVVSLEDLKILASRDNPEVNRNEKSFPLYLFD